MSRTLSTIAASVLVATIANPVSGTISLVGGNDGFSRITGEVYRSYRAPGLLVVETEHGSIYLDLEADITISEENGESNLDTNELYALNDHFTEYLATIFGWHTFAKDDRDEALNDLVHGVAALIDELLEKAPAVSMTDD